jgi:hypothetical protein
MSDLYYFEQHTGEIPIPPEYLAKMTRADTITHQAVHAIDKRLTVLGGLDGNGEICLVVVGKMIKKIRTSFDTFLDKMKHH